METDVELTIQLPEPHVKQATFIDSPAKRKIIRAGRRGGKTVGVSILAVEKFLAGRRILYAVPTAEQLGRFWTTVVTSLAEPIKAGYFYKNETEHVIELRGTEQRIKGKTAWNADTLRGDYADLLILDEWQLMDEDAWEIVGVPMMLDHNGNVVFVYTPPSIKSQSVSKAKDPQHAPKMFKRARELHDADLKEGREPRWETFHFSSHENPHLDETALIEIVGDMTPTAYRQEIMAEDLEEAPGALWHLATIEETRVYNFPDLESIYVGVDPSGTATGDECGIVVAGKANNHAYVLDDLSVQGSPETWAKAVVTAYHKWRADKLVVEVNFGGEMVRLTIGTVDKYIPIEEVTASRGKMIRAEPVSILWEQKRAHLVGSFPYLEAEMTMWSPGEPSPNRVDAMVWAVSRLMLGTAPSGKEWLDALKAQAEKQKQEEAEQSSRSGVDRILVRGK